MIVGRFRDGTPLTTQGADGAHSPIMNDFDYDSDDLAGKCPFYGHVRKTDPRGSGGFEPQSNERLHLMARRGQTYGNRTDNPTDESLPLSSRPTTGIGLCSWRSTRRSRRSFSSHRPHGRTTQGFPASPLTTRRPVSTTSSDRARARPQSPR
jgi:deferrochelatase/peroxidase EfeB